MIAESPAQLVLPFPLFAQAAAEAPVVLPTPTAVPSGPTVEDDRLRLCIEQAGKDPTTSLAQASAWVAEARGIGRSKPLECLGQVLTVLARWEAAETAFADAAQAAPLSDPARVAVLRAQAGNAALAGDKAERALAQFDAALAGTGLDPAARGQIALDRARALVVLQRPAEAMEAIAAAQRDAPDEPLAWLLGATLARRGNDLAAAQRQIEVAGSLAPKDPDIGLEAGVIAVLGGRETAARKAWESVQLVAPESAAAETAKSYLAQLGAAPPPKPAAGR